MTDAAAVETNQSNQETFHCCAPELVHFQGKKFIMIAFFFFYHYQCWWRANVLTGVTEGQQQTDRVFGDQTHGRKSNIERLIQNV